MSIILLDEATISKIAAGEIIENPASIVKELLENSIDAEAKNIIVEIKGSPSEFIKISDDGLGMDREDLKLAFYRHSTSKLKNIQDLNNISSLGFRGEALASIAHIAKLEVLTKSKEEKVGSRAIVSNGEVNNLSHVGMPQGTTFYVRDIFYNTPVRKKYLKSDNTEFNYIYDVVQKISLSNSNISVKLIRDGKVIMSSIANNNIKNHIYSILGKDLTANLIPINFISHSYKITGFISNNKLYRSNRYHQYIYINGRYVRNLEISKKIEKYYYSLIPLNRFPVFILYIEIDPILIDVNIHPKKHEVKLSKDNNLIAILADLVEEALYPNRVIPNPLTLEEKNKNDYKNIFDLYNTKSSEDDYNLKEESSNEVENNFLDESKVNNNSNINLDGIENNVLINDFTNQYNSTMENKNAIELKKDEDSIKHKINYDLLNSKFVGIIFNTFIILEKSNEKFLYLIDQHAAHERILYEKYKKQFETSNALSQALLQPYILNLTPMQKNLIENNLDLFSNLGFDISDFGETEMVVREIPIIFGEAVKVNFIYEIIDSLERINNSTYEVDPYKIMKKACKAAIKAGDKISPIEVNALIKDLLNCENPYSCPHGRPTVIEVKKYDIEKIFLRE